MKGTTEFDCNSVCRARPSVKYISLRRVTVPLWDGALRAIYIYVRSNFLLTRSEGMQYQ